MGASKSQILLTEDNPWGELTINNIKLAAYIAHLHIVAPLMNPLERIANKGNNTAAEG